MHVPQEGQPHAQDATRGVTCGVKGAAAALQGLDNQGQIVIRHQGGIQM